MMSRIPREPFESGPAAQEAIDRLRDGLERARAIVRRAKQAMRRPARRDKAPPPSPPEAEDPDRSGED